MPHATHRAPAKAEFTDPVGELAHSCARQQKQQQMSGMYSPQQAPGRKQTKLAMEHAFIAARKLDGVDLEVPAMIARTLA